ncbi:hypothetical protein JXM67_12700 [candidate division WOR-3 bacterium]|nr:hypothetical protein [candidate division WOR-3 bacterium]
MARVRNEIYRVVNRSGESIFRFLSSCEDKRGLSKLARFLKLSCLGFLVIVISACGKKQAQPEGITSCYMIAESYLRISEISVEPNPTENTPQVKIDAIASIEGDTAGSFVKEANAFIGKDTLILKAADGAFDNPKEEITGKFFVGNYKPGNYELHIKAQANTGAWDEEGVNLKVSD